MVEITQKKDNPTTWHPDVAQRSLLPWYFCFMRNT